MTTCGLVRWIRIVKSQGVSLHLLANSFPRHFSKRKDLICQKLGQGKNSERDFPLEFVGPSPSVSQWRLPRRAEGNPSGTHSEALSREVTDCKRYMKRSKNQKKKKNSSKTLWTLTQCNEEVVQRLVQESWAERVLPRYRKPRAKLEGRKNSPVTNKASSWI